MVAVPERERKVPAIPPKGGGRSNRTIKMLDSAVLLLVGCLAGWVCVYFFSPRSAAGKLPFVELREDVDLQNFAPLSSPTVEKIAMIAKCSADGVGGL